MDTLISYPSGATFWFDADRGSTHGGVPGGSFGAGGGWAVSGDSLVGVLDAYHGRLSWYRVERTGLARFARVELGTSPVRITTNELRELEQRARTATRVSLTRVGLIAPPYKAFLGSRPLLDEVGRMWVRVEDSSAGDVLIAVSPTGDRRMLIRLPPDFAPTHLRKDILAGMRRTEQDVHIVEQYHLRF